jgi:hypothetical protein
MARALEHIVKMRGGAQSHLLRCSHRAATGEMRDDGYFVVKFRNNPQHVRILANELLASRLADFVGLPVPHVEQVEVPEDLISGTPELRIELPGGSEPCAWGRQVGSKFPGDPRYTAVFDWIPDETLERVSNLDAFWGALVFDQWVCNTDGRQTVFYREPGQQSYKVLMIDQGFCFNDGEWNFPDAPLRGLYLRRQVYRGVTGWPSLEKWMQRIELMDPAAMERIFQDVPPEWCGEDWEAGLEDLYTRLLRRRGRLRDLLTAVRKSSANPFPYWKE